MTCKSIKKFLNLCSDVYKTQNFGGIIEKKVWILSNIFLSKEFPQRKVVIVPHLRGGGPSTMYHLKLTLFCRRPCGLKETFLFLVFVSILCCFPPTTQPLPGIPRWNLVIRRSHEINKIIIQKNGQKTYICGPCCMCGSEVGNEEGKWSKRHASYKNLPKEIFLDWLVYSFQSFPQFPNSFVECDYALWPLVIDDRFCLLYLYCLYVSPLPSLLFPCWE